MPRCGVFDIAPRSSPNYSPYVNVIGDPVWTPTMINHAFAPCAPATIAKAAPICPVHHKS